MVRQGGLRHGPSFFQDGFPARRLHRPAVPTDKWQVIPGLHFPSHSATPTGRPAEHSRHLHGKPAIVSGESAFSSHGSRGFPHRHLAALTKRSGGDHDRAAPQTAFPATAHLHSAAAEPPTVIPLLAGNCNQQQRGRSTKDSTRSWVYFLMVFPFHPAKIWRKGGTRLAISPASV